MKTQYTMATNIIATLSLIPLADDTVKHYGLAYVYLCTRIRLSVYVYAHIHWALSVICCNNLDCYPKVVFTIFILVK